MGFAKIRGKLTSRIGCTVNYGPPGDVKKVGGTSVSGTIVDEVWADPERNDLPCRQATSNQDWGDYSFCSQLIRWNQGNYSIRLAYYRRRAGEDHWEFASQMTVDADWETIKALFEKTLAKNQWFADNPDIVVSRTV